MLLIKKSLEKKKKQTILCNAFISGMWDHTDNIFRASQTEEQNSFNW